MRLAVGDGHMRKLTEKSESNRAQNRFLETCADDGVAVRPQQHRRAVFQDLCQRFTPFDGADETRLGIDRRAFGREKSRVHVHRPKTAFQYTEKRAPLRVGMANAHQIRTSAHDTGVNRPLIGRRFLTTEITAIEVQQDEPIQRRPAGTHTGQSKKSVGTANAHAHMTIAVGDAFAIEDVTAVDQFLLEFLELNGIESGHVGDVHGISFRYVFVQLVLLADPQAVKAALVLRSDTRSTTPRYSLRSLCAFVRTERIF